MRDIINIIEAFDAPVEISWVKQSRGQCVGSFEVSDLTYTVVIYAFEFEGKEWHTIAFTSPTQRAGISDSRGNQFKIFATTIEAFREYVGRYDPNNIIILSAADDARQPLYAVIAKKLGAEISGLGYLPTDVPELDAIAGEEVEGIAWEKTGA